MSEAPNDTIATPKRWRLTARSGQPPPNGATPSGTATPRTLNETANGSGFDQPGRPSRRPDPCKPHVALVGRFKRRRGRRVHSAAGRPAQWRAHGSQCSPARSGRQRTSRGTSRHRRRGPAQARASCSASVSLTRLPASSTITPPSSWTMIPTPRAGLPTPRRVCAGICACSGRCSTPNTSTPWTPASMTSRGRSQRSATWTQASRAWASTPRTPTQERPRTR